MSFWLGRGEALGQAKQLGSRTIDQAVAEAQVNGPRRIATRLQYHE
jgi:hypothetical protein